MGKVRLISGKFGGRWIATPDTSATHPMSSRARIALFNKISVEGKTVLDAFAGSGALGLECLSRGARQVVFVEKNPLAARTIRQNLARLDATEDATVCQMPIERFVKSQTADSPLFDVILADPPYDNFEFSTVLSLKTYLRPNGLMVVSYPGRLREPTVNGVVVVDNRRYGEAALAVLRPE
ncbi:MAG: 16S rRNA (guanine(966)-N(2))-methyltransferase RsmD [Candidatus Nomurabacteria bacterium]|jgi:16S rRNA (guanine(966)-N(2))-methyltransferase RsmD|nr:16S rRNA (guanine(966)-N(2))-methyltransferase RsmD [Candidatus Nomurabacteria bacterium]